MDFSDLPSSHFAPIGDALTTRSRQRRVRLHEARYACRAGEFRRALPLLERAATAFRSGVDPAPRLEALSFYLRCVSELERFDRLTWIEGQAREALERADEAPQVQSRAWSLLGACSRARASGASEAEALFRKALDLALAAEDREGVAHAAFGGASSLYALGRMDACLAKLNCLDALLPTLKSPELVSAARLLRGLALRDLGRLDEAIAWIWSSCEALRGDPQVALYARTLTALSSVLRAKGQPREARLYLDLAEKTVRSEDMPALSRLLAGEFAKSEGRAATSDPTEVLFDSKAGVVRVAGREVRLEGQVVLRDLMKAFLERPGRAFAKAEIAALLWNEPYDPGLHDNKIYVTIKRLRRCLDDGKGGRRLVLRAKDGYFFNPKIVAKLV